MCNSIYMADIKPTFYLDPNTIEHFRS